MVITNGISILVDRLIILLVIIDLMLPLFIPTVLFCRVAHIAEPALSSTDFRSPVLTSSLSILIVYQVKSVVTDASTMEQSPRNEIMLLVTLLVLEREGSMLLWIIGGKRNARGHPMRLPISETSLSRLSIVMAAMTPSKQTSTDAITFLWLAKELRSPQVLSIQDAIDRQAISNEGKFCNGKVKMTAKLYASCTVVANVPEGKDVVMTVRTSSPNAIQHVKPKKV